MADVYALLLEMRREREQDREEVRTEFSEMRRDIDTLKNKLQYGNSANASTADAAERILDKVSLDFVQRHNS